MDDLRVRRERADLAGHPIVEAQPDAKDDVGLVHHAIRVRAPVHAEHPARERVILRERADAEERGHDGGVDALRERAELAMGASEPHPVARDDHGALGAGQQRGCTIERVGVRAVWLDRDVGRPAAGDGHPELDVLRDIDDDRSRPAGRGHGEGPVDGGLDVLDPLHEVGMLRDRPDETEDVGLLEGVAAHERRRHLAGDGDHRDAVHVRAGETGDEIRGARTRCRDAHAHASGGARVAVGHVGGTLLVTHEDVMDRRVVGEGVIEREARAAGVAKGQVHTGVLERAPDEVGAAQRDGLRVGDRHLGAESHPGQTHAGRSTSVVR